MSFFQVNFRLLTAPLPPGGLGPIDLEFLDVDNRRAKFDLSVEFWEEADALAGYIEYYVDLFDRATIRKMGEDFERLLGSVVSQPDAPLRSLEAPPRGGAGRPAARAAHVPPGGPMRRQLGEVNARHPLSLRVRPPRTALARTMKTPSPAIGFARRG